MKKSSWKPLTSGVSTLATHTLAQGIDCRIHFVVTYNDTNRINFAKSKPSEMTEGTDNFFSKVKEISIFGSFMKSKRVYSVVILTLIGWPFSCMCGC